MYKAIHPQTGEEIIILNPFWIKRIEKLRSMDHSGLLVCQGCRQPLRVKAGESRRPHFAHKHLEACSYGTESPEILNARAVLYAWLFMQFGNALTVEKQVEGMGLPRPVDCWVDTASECFGYWIIEAGIKWEPREAIRAGFDQAGVKLQPIFLHTMLKEEKKEIHSLLLSPTERFFMQSTSYDAVASTLAEVGNSLHYLDPEQQMLTTYRGLRLYHAPNWYKGTKISSKLSLLKANPTDGEPVHPGEEKRLKTYQQKQQRLAEKRRLFEARETAWEERISSSIYEKPEALPSGKDSTQPETNQEMPALPCVICGQITTEYWSTFFNEDGRKLCRCRECLDRESK